MATKRQSTRKVRESVVNVDSGTDENSKARFSPNSSSSSSSMLQTRIQEKDELSHLNDRLAGYIEHVRNLEDENKCLKIKIEDTDSSRRREVLEITDQYEKKLEELRDRLQNLTAQSARGEILKAKAIANETELKARVNELEKLLKTTDSELQDAVRKVQDLTARSNNAENAVKHLEKNNVNLTHERDACQRQIAVLQKQLEDEVVLRTEVEARWQECKEDLEFSRRNHTTQMDEFHRKRQIEMTTYGVEIENRYKTQLQEQLQEMRNDFDRRIAQNRAEMDGLFNSKLAEAEESANQNRAMANEAREEASRYRFRVNELQQTISDHEKQVNALNARIKELEQTLRGQQEESSMRLRQRDDRIANLEADAAKMIRDYQDLIDVKTQLVTELQAYRHLLESEETRLSINTSNKPSPNVSRMSLNESTSSQRRGTKRKHEEANFVDFINADKIYKSFGDSTGDIVIAEVSMDGHFIRLSNNGDEDIPLGGYYLKSTADEKEVTFKFHSRQVFKAGKSITIWSNNVGREPNSPTDVVMKNQQWPTGEAMRIEFLTPQEDVYAFYECMQENLYKKFASGKNDGEDKCCVM